MKSSNHRKKILFVQSELNPLGGGEAVAVWMLEALSPEYDVTILTSVPIDMENVNRYYGTSLRAADFTIRVMPAFFRLLLDHLPGQTRDYMRVCGLIRWCKLIGHRFDIVMSAYNEMDYGVKGLQYVHYPFHRDNWAREVYLNRQDRWYSRFLRFFETRLRIWRLVSGFSFRRMKENLTIVNSRWTGEWFTKTYGENTYTIYPPVHGEFPEIPWQEKENGFVCMGRISHVKRLSEIVDILCEVRRACPEISLHIIGAKTKSENDYYKQIRRKIAPHESWISLHENIHRDELIALISRNRYGIHGMINEHFGIAVAEMLRGGCIPFIPSGGGQTEIIGDEERLMYRNDADAVEKILRVLQSPSEQRILYQNLSLRKSMFTADEFVRRMRNVVSSILRQMENVQPDLFAVAKSGPPDIDR